MNAMKHVYFVIIGMMVIVLLSCQPKGEILLEAVDPLQKVFPESNYFAPMKAHADAARGENASFQLVVRGTSTITDLQIKVEPFSDGNHSLNEIKTGFIGFVKVGRKNPEPSKDSYAPISGFYPDPIIYREKQNVPFGTTQPLWISVKVPTNAVPGDYQSKIEISGNISGRRFIESKDMTLKVYKPVIEKTSLWVTNWFFPDRLKYLNNNKDVRKYSDKYWELMKILAHTLAEYRQNVAMISPLEYTNFKMVNNQWTFDFTNFNKLVQLFIDEGVIGRLEGGHLGRRIDGGWLSPFGLSVPVIENDSVRMEMMLPNSEKLKQFYKAFLPALYQNIEQKGWTDRYIQHIADEPINENVASYIEISKFIKNLVPQIKIVEACHSHLLDNMVDVWVPQLNFLRDGIDFYTAQQAKGKEVWFYTCLAPKGEFANRFIELPLIKTRLLHWVNYRYGINGYLHWGYNYWGTESPYDDTSGIILSSGNILPGGDSWIVYPGENTLYPSIRLEAMRDGIVDYELLKMYNQAFPEKAKEMVRTTVYHFEHYDTNLGDFRKKRRQILEDLSK